MKHDQRSYHALNEVLDAVEESAPWIKIVIAHDNDYLSVLETGAIVPPGPDLAAMVMKKFVIDVDAVGNGILVHRDDARLKHDDLAFVFNLEREVTDVTLGFDAVRNGNIPAGFLLLPPAYGEGITLFPDGTVDNGKLFTKDILSCSHPVWKKKLYTMFSSYCDEEGTFEDGFLDPEREHTYIAFAERLCQGWIDFYCHILCGVNDDIVAQPFDAKREALFLHEPTHSEPLKYTQDEIPGSMKSALRGKKDTIRSAIKACVPLLSIPNWPRPCSLEDIVQYLNFRQEQTCIQASWEDQKFEEDKVKAIPPAFSTGQSHSVGDGSSGYQGSRRGRHVPKRMNHLMVEQYSCY